MKWYVTERSEKIKYYSSTVMQDVIIEKGWGNGYVALPPTHPLYLGTLDSITDNSLIQIKIDLVGSLDVHGGITYNDFGDGVNAPIDWWVLGFDTAHYGDTLEKWPKEAVEAETKRLFCQLLDIELGEL
jgi:hypothetical protein